MTATLAACDSCFGRWSIIRTERIFKTIDMKYFVSYVWYSDSERGFGRSEYELKRKMDIALIAEIERDLELQLDKANVCVISFQEF